MSTIPQSVVPVMDDTRNQNATTIGDERGVDSAIGSDDSGNVIVQPAEQSAVTDSQGSAANQSLLQGTQSSNVPSDVAAAPISNAEPAPGTDNDLSVNPPSPLTATQAPIYQTANDDIDAQPKSTLDALLANLAQPVQQQQQQATPSTFTLPPTPQTATNGTSPISSLPSNPNLPPKPPAQEKPTTHPNYTPADDIRSYHPHSQKDVAGTYRPAHALPNITTSSLPPPPYAFQTPMSATMPLHSPAQSAFGQRDHTPMSSGADEDTPFDRNLQLQYDSFLTFEKLKVAEGQWDQFLPGSRLFIGNLPTEKVTKRDVFRRFHTFGTIAQISLKNAFGFVQYLDPESCRRAVQSEQGTRMAGRTMHLEVSKPQKHSANRGARRSRSPDYNHAGRGQQSPRNVDRYTSGAHVSPRDRDFRRQRDDYRPARSPSPRGYRGTDRYDARRRSRSRSPYGRQDVRRRSPPPRRETDDGLPLPHRMPGDAPDVMILIADELNVSVQDLYDDVTQSNKTRQFIQWVEKSIQARGIRTQVLLLTPHLPEQAVVRRQIVEGVQAIVRLLRAHEHRGKIPLQLFDRRGGHDNVQFEQYEDLDPNMVADLVLRARQTLGAAQPPAPSYGMPPAPAPPAGYGLPSNYGYPSAQAPSRVPPPASNPNVSSILASLGATNPAANADIARLLSNPHQPQPAGISPDLARILAQVSQTPQPAPQPAPQYQQSPTQQNYGQHPPPPVANLYSAPPASYGGAQHRPSPVSQPPVQTRGPSQPAAADLQQILAGLTAYRPPA